MMSLLSSMDARRRRRDLHLRSLRRRRARSSRQPLPTRCCFTMALLREKVPLLHHGQVHAGQQAGNAAHGRAVPLLGAVGQLLPRHHVGAAPAFHVLSGAVAPAGFLPFAQPAAVLKNGQAFHLARSKGGHAALGIAAACGQHLVAECFQLAVNAADVGDGGVAQIGRQVREGGVLLIGLRRDAIGGVAQKRRLGQLGDDVGLAGIVLCCAEHLEALDM